MVVVKLCEYRVYSRPPMRKMVCVLDEFWISLDFDFVRSPYGFYGMRWVSACLVFAFGRFPCRTLFVICAALLVIAFIIYVSWSSAFGA